MDQNLRDVFINKFEELREHERYCTIQWQDTKTLAVIAQKYILLSSSHSPEINVNYTIVIDDVRRHGIVLAKGNPTIRGTKRECEFILNKLSSHKSPSEVVADSSVDNLLLMKILGKIIHKNELDKNNNSSQYVHHTHCASCRMEPIRNVDRYHCLECSKYDLCGNCFAKSHETNNHSSGHAMVHFRLPDEFLGIHVNDIDHEVTLDKIKQLHTLTDEQHNRVTCDGYCGKKHFIGLRFKCAICRDYDLCETCAIEKRAVTKNHRSNHPLILTSKKILPQINATDIQLGDVLGQGGFGCVRKVFWPSKNLQVACKVIDVPHLSMLGVEKRKSFLRELAANRELSGPYFVRIFAYAIYHPTPDPFKGPTEQCMIIMEFMERGSLNDILKKEQHALANDSDKISLRRKLTMARQIASGMRHIHQHGMTHRDIRPDNILIAENYDAKITDMGIARVLDPVGLQTQIGCDEFMPPEFYSVSVDGRIKSDEKLDIFTYGLTLNQLFTGIMHNYSQYSMPHTSITKASPFFYDEIISKCLDDDPKRRPTALKIEQILELYERAFSEDRAAEAYKKMNTQNKDQVFRKFYDNNKLHFQNFIEEQFPRQSSQEILFGVPFQQDQLLVSDEQQIDDPCRIN